MKKTLITLGIGAGIMYLMDPEHGEERRARLVDAFSGRMPKTKDALQAKAESLHFNVDHLAAKADDATASAVNSAETVISDVTQKVAEKATGIAGSVTEKATGIANSVGNKGGETGDKQAGESADKPSKGGGSNASNPAGHPT